MPSTNGHGPRRAVLYARVSTDEQARSGYSLAHEGGFDLGRFPAIAAWIERVRNQPGHVPITQG